MSQEINSYETALLMTLGKLSQEQRWSSIINMLIASIFQ